MTTIKEELERIANSTGTTETDDKIVQSVLRRIGFNSVVTYGICYLEGKGQPISIQSAAKQLLDAFERQKNGMEN